MKMDYILIHTPKNILQYLFGVVLYFVLVSTKISILTIFLGLISFSFTYLVVYLYNDLVDYEEDKKNPVKRKLKALARGDLSKKVAQKSMYLFGMLGLLLSLFVNLAFTSVLVILLFLNFLYTSKYTRLRDSKIGAPVSWFCIELFKYSLGWVAITSSLRGIPYYLIIMLALSYVSIAFYYKNLHFSLNQAIEHVPIIISFSLTSLFFTISFFVYDLKLPMFLLSLAAYALFILFFVIHPKNILRRVQLFAFATNLLLLLLILFVLALKLPFFSNLNSEFEILVSRLISFPPKIPQI